MPHPYARPHTPSPGRLRRVLLAAVPVAALLVAVPAPVARAAAPTVTCGATLTRDTTLTADLSCAGSGVTLGPGVTLDLGGHQLLGDGLGTGITLTPGGPTGVRHGTVGNWATGILLGDTADLSRTEVSLSRLSLSTAPLAVATAELSLTEVSLTSSPLDLNLTDTIATRTSFHRSDARGEMNTMTLRSSRVRGGGLAQDENNTVTVIDSRLDGSGYLRPALLCGGEITIIRSTVQDYVVPLYANAASCPLTITDSTFRNNPHGAVLSEVAGEEVSARISGSSFSGSGNAVTGGRVAISTSTFTRNLSGVLLSDAAGSSISGSTFSRNSRSGIIALDAGLALRANTAYRNRGYGIHAPGAIDLGGNRARGNRLGDCVGVSC